MESLSTHYIGQWVACSGILPYTTTPQDIGGMLRYIVATHNVADIGILLYIATLHGAIGGGILQYTTTLQWGSGQ